jgi:hypothetical protein
MNRSASERWLTALLFVQAGILACALPAAVMPTEWMDAVHQSLGMGLLPRAPLVEYLTRSISLLYASWAPLLVLMGTEPRRYLPMVRLLAWLMLAGGALFPALDLWAGMPLAWTMGEGLSLLLLGLGTAWLEARVRSEAEMVSEGVETEAG